MIAKKFTSQFVGRQLVETPQVNYLGGDLGKEVHSAIASHYKEFPVVTYDISYDEKSDLVKGSKPFYLVAVNHELRGNALHTATPAELEMILAANARKESLGLNFLGTYEDSALVVRTDGDPNKYLAKHLVQQLRARNPKLKLPVMIPLTGFDLVKDQNSPYGLSFVLRDEADIIYAPILNSKDNSFDSKQINASTGLPLKLGTGSRNFYARKEGISRLFLSRGLDLGSYDESLADSVVGGRVVIVGGEAAGFEIAQQLQEQQKANSERVQRAVIALYDTQKAEIEQKFTQAQKLFQGK